MLPSTNNLADIKIVEYADTTYKLNTSKERIIGTIDKIEAVKQASYLILNTERYENIIYSWNYGLETKDLVGEDYLYVCSELKRRIPEALCQDDRINSVASFSFNKNREKVLAKFTVHTIYGDIEESKEVEI